MVHQDSLEFYEPLEQPPESLPDESLGTQPLSLPPLLTGSDSYSPDIIRRSLPIKRKEKKEKKAFSHMFRRSKKSKEKLVDPGSTSIGTFETQQAFKTSKSSRKLSPRLLKSGSGSHRRAKSCDLSNSLSNESEESYDGEGKTLNSEEELIATLVNPSHRGSITKRSASVQPGNGYTPHQDSLTVPNENRVSVCVCVCVGGGGGGIMYNI